MKFCGHCGAPLRAEPAETAAELRQLTVLFCDLVGSTALAETLDPEELRELTSAYHEACESVIRRHDGRIAQYLGDGVLVYFGHPVAHEDDARRAVRAALGIVGALSALSARFQQERRIAFNARLGIHTGPVVVGEVGGGEHREQLALGKTPNVAARIQNIAEPGTVVVSDDTYRLVRGFFDFVPLGAHDLKGLSEPVTLHQAVRESGADSRLDVARRVGLTPLTGRERELQLLEAQWHAVSKSGRHTVLVQGEAGIGKSRIVDALRDQVVRESATVLECFCTPYAQGTALFPVAGLIERTLGFTRESTESIKRSALDGRLEQRGIYSAERSALMSHLLSIPISGADVVADYSPQRRRERTLEVLREWLVATTHDGPVLWVVEDLHWADPTTLEFISTVMNMASAEPLLVVLTFRPEFPAPWHANGRVSSVALARLGPADTTSMAARVARGKSFPAEVLEQIIARTEGIPLFVEEVTKAVLELGVLREREDRFELAGPLPPDLIPATVQGSLNARLDRLGPAKALAQLAATIGREFRFDLLQSVADESESVLRAGLDRLLGAELVFRIDDALEETYLFKHALIQDAAYSSLLKKARRRLHQRIAESLTSGFPDVASSRPELVAEHWTRAGRAQEAVTHWSLAGKLAVDRASYTEAIAHLNRGLTLVPDLPEAGRLEMELDFHSSLIPSLIATQGWASIQLGHVYGRAGEIVDLLGETPHRFVVLSGTLGYHLVAGRITQALELARPVLDLATRLGNPVFLALARQDHAASLLFHGDLHEAVEQAEAGMAQYDAETERITARIFGLSCYVGFLCYEMEAFWMLGFPERSLQASDRSVALARQMGHASSLACAINYRLAGFALQRDASRTLKMAEECIRQSQEERLAFWEPVARIYRGSALCALGETAQSITEIRDGFARYRAMGGGIKTPQFLSILAEALWNAGERDEAMEALADAMAHAASNGDAYMEPDLYRMKGVFLDAQASIAVAGMRNADRDFEFAEAERWVREAVERSRRQRAASLELRALVSLVRMRNSRGVDVAGEREALSRVYATFTEGFDTLDLREAREMLGAPAG